MTITDSEWNRVSTAVHQACAGIPDVSPQAVLTEVERTVYPGISEDDLSLAQIMAARTLIEAEPGYSKVTARLLLNRIRQQALAWLDCSPATQQEMRDRYPAYFTAYVERGIELGQLDPQLAEFDLSQLGEALIAENDLAFSFLGLQTLYDRYLLHHEGTRYELPQAFFMRVAMGLALREDNPTERAVEFYNLLSSFDFMCSTPTLFNAGTTRPQLSSCFLTTVEDDLAAIFHSISNNAMLSK